MFRAKGLGGSLSDRLFAEAQWRDAVRGLEDLGEMVGVFEARLKRDFLDGRAGLLEQPGSLIQTKFFQKPLRARSRKFIEQPREMLWRDMASARRLRNPIQSRVMGLKIRSASLESAAGG